MDTDRRRMNRVFWPTREGEGGCAGAEQEAARRPRELTERDVGGAGGEQSAPWASFTEAKQKIVN